MPSHTTTTSAPEPTATSPLLPTDPSTDNHAYIRGDPANMGPCPALNALANHGYLPRDGRNITLDLLQRAFTETLHLSWGLTRLLSSPAHRFLKDRDSFSLVDLREHNVIEHDGSFTRLNHSTSPSGDNFAFQPTMLRTMINDDARGGPVTVRTLARTYNRRKREERESGVEKLSWRLWFVGLSQTVSFLTVSGLGSQGIDKGVMWEFYGEERWPDAILENKEKRGLLGALGRILVLLFWIVVGGE